MKYSAGTISAHRVLPSSRLVTYESTLCLSGSRFSASALQSALVYARSTLSLPFYSFLEHPPGQRAPQTQRCVPLCPTKAASPTKSALIPRSECAFFLHSNTSAIRPQHVYPCPIPITNNSKPTHHCQIPDRMARNTNKTPGAR